MPKFAQAKATLEALPEREETQADPNPTAPTSNPTEQQGQ